MDDVQVVGLDLAKHVFQVHGLAGNGRIVIRRQLRRGRLLAFFGELPCCIVGTEACASS